MTEHTLRSLLIDLERAETLEDVKRCTTKLLLAVVQINSEIESMRHPHGVRNALLKFTAK